MALDDNGAAVLAQAAAGVVVISPDGRAALNAAAQRLLGLGPAAGVSELPAPEAAAAALAGRAPGTTVVPWRRSGDELALVVSWTALREGDRVTGALAVLQDVTPLARRERQLYELFAHVAHQLRTPLTPILGWARMLVQKRPADTMLQRAAEVIERNVRLEVRLVDEMLDLSRMQRGTLEIDRRRLDLREACRAAADEVRGLIVARRVDFQETYPPEALWVDADPGRVQQIIATLLDHAVAFTPDGGRVAIAAGREGGEVGVVVSDSGGGIAAEQVALLFEAVPAARRGPEGGLGVGLAVARYLAERHGGVLEAAGGGPDPGRRFHLRLPYRPDAGAGA